MRGHRTVLPAVRGPAPGHSFKRGAGVRSRMADRPVRVAAVVRSHGDLLRCRDGAASDDGPTLPSVSADAGEDAAAALGRLLDGLGLAEPTVERRGDAVETPDGPLVPFLVAALSREGVGGGGSCPDPGWGPPAELRRGADERWRRAYAAVAPTVETVAGDETRGSTALATDALWALRDAASDAAARGAGLAPVAATARALLDARPAMVALGNRVDRAMAGAPTPAAVEDTASAAIERAHAADAAAARLAAEAVAGDRVLTLSRSGTVRAALLEARPDVLVAASRPGGEGLAVADELADAGLSASTCADAEIYDRLRSGEVGSVLVGADAVTPAGGVANKVGTWAAALAACWVDVPAYVACASDKVRPAGEGDRAPLELLFDLTPPGFVTAILTERGRLAPAEVRAVAEEHRELGAWRR